MDSRVRFPQRQIIEEDKIGALFLCTFYGHTTLYLVLSLCRFCNYFYLYKWEVAELVGLFFSFMFKL